MQERSKVAATTAAVVPFHCVICFEEFCLKKRLPVVLPCGHTYVCTICASRLKRCMECREPLFYHLPKPQPLNPIPSPSVVVPRGSRYSPTPVSPPHPPRLLPQSSMSTKVQYPMPKNVVLISMMEAASRQVPKEDEEVKNPDEEGEQREEQGVEEASGSSSSSSMMDSDSEEDEYDLNRIISGMATLAGPCGTYAVKDPEGLEIVTTDPSRKSRNDPLSSVEEEEIVHVAMTYSAESIEIKEPNRLEKGQKVQVVDFEHGVAKLARGAGFIAANSSQLVKIGGPLEKSCRLEGLLDTVVKRGDDLQKELDENRKIEDGLRREIEAQLQVEPNHPVIAEAPRTHEEVVAPCAKDDDEPLTPRSECFKPLHTPETSPDGPDRLPVGIRDENHRQTGIFNQSPASIDNADIDGRGGFLPAFRRRDSSESLTGLDYGCSAFLGESIDIFAGGPRVPHDSNMLLGPTVSGENRTRNNIHDEQHIPTFTSSFDTIDFRTGLSGHRGLQTSKGYSPTPRGRVRMMSVHTGIGRAAGPLHHRTESSNSQG